MDYSIVPGVLSDVCISGKESFEDFLCNCPVCTHQALINADRQVTLIGKRKEHTSEFAESWLRCVQSTEPALPLECYLDQV